MPSLTGKIDTIERARLGISGTFGDSASSLHEHRKTPQIYTIFITCAVRFITQ